MSGAPRSVGRLAFSFDILVVHIKLTTIEDVDVTKIKVEANFLKTNLPITPSRINVDEFNPRRSLRFAERPTVLKEHLEKTAFDCTVFYDNKPIGKSSFAWPESFTSCLTGDCGRELMHCIEVEIKNENECVGKMQIFARLQMMCEEFSERQVVNPKPDLCNRPDTSVIDPNDILFVVKEDKSNIICNECELIRGSESISSSNHISLDLSDFRTINGQTLTNADILKTLDVVCCKQKKDKSQYEQVVEDITKKAKQTQPDCSSMPSKCEQRKMPWDQQTKPIDFMSESRFPSCSSSGINRPKCCLERNYSTCEAKSNNPCYCVSDENTSEDKHTVCRSDVHMQKPAKRNCPLCHENVTWLPKYAACPKCGFKPIPYTEKPYDYKITADKILQECTCNKMTDKTTTDVASTTHSVASLPHTECRCTCQNGKICAHCRIRQLCADIIQPRRKNSEDCGKCETKSSEVYNVCKTSSRDCRPHLAKVFQELKNIYEIKRSQKKIQSEPSKETVPLRPFDNQKALAIERKKFEKKNFSTHNVCKGRVYDYNSHRNYPGVQIGHKTCLNGFGRGRNVPRNMGWLWNAEAKGLRTGWVPGAVRKPIKALMQHFLKKSNRHPCEDIDQYEISNKADGEEENYTKEATLHICKKNSVYYVTLRPLKNPEVLKECSNPYVDMHPIQFKITKHPFLLEVRNLKKDLKRMGFPKCVCHLPISDCCCRSLLERKKLEDQCTRECEQRRLPSVCDTLVLSDTSDSEGEFEFGVTPPAGVPHPERCTKRKKVSTGTQYETDDWIIKDEYPKILPKYIKLYNCAIGHRFGRAFGPYGRGGYKAGASPIEGIYGPNGIIPERTGRKGKIQISGDPESFLGPDGKFDMAKYLAYKAMTAPSPEILTERKRQRLALLRGGNAPLLCTIDRLGKPTAISSCCNLAPCNPGYMRDDRIC